MTPSIGSPAPFYISSNTQIQVCLSTNDHQLIADIGYYMVAPDGITTLTLKKGLMETNFFSPPCIGADGDANNLCFTTELPLSDTLNTCAEPLPLSGTFAATGNWNLFYGLNPAQGGWAVMVKDTAAQRGGIDGEITNATISFIDTATATHILTAIDYVSGAIHIPILEPTTTDYIVPRGLRVSCAGECDAIGLVNVTGGTPPYVNFTWSPLPSSGNGTDSVVFCAGTYNLTVTDALGCTGTTSVDVIAPPAIIINSVNYTHSLTCFGDLKGIINVKASGGTGSLTYTLFPGNIISASADSGYFAGLAANIYTVVIKDSKGCSVDTTITISQSAQISLIASVTKNISCSGNNDGQIIALASGGMAPYTYILGPVDSINSSGIFNNLAPGIYTVGVTDLNHCDTVFSSALVVNTPAPLIIDTVLVEPIACSSDSGRIGVVISGGTTDYWVSLTGGADSMRVPSTSILRLRPDSIEGIDASITSYRPDSNAYNHKDFHAFAWTFNAIPVFGRGLIAFDLSKIPAGTHVLDAKLSLYSYDDPGFHGQRGSNASLLRRIISPWGEKTVTWNNQPPTTAQNEVLLPTSDSSIESYLNINITALIQEMVNKPDSNFGMLMQLDTEQFYRRMGFASSDYPDTSLHPKLVVTYSIGTQPDTAYFTVPAGNYNIVVYDANGCSATWPTVVTLTDPPALVMDSVVVTHIKGCSADSTGQIRAYASGGIGTIKYSLDGKIYQTANLFDSLAGGNYKIYYRDSIGCVHTYNTTINKPAKLWGNPTITDVQGNNLGAIQFNATGGTRFSAPKDYLYSIDGGLNKFNTSLFDSLPGGTYPVHVEDSLGCPWDSTVIIGIHNLIVGVSWINPACYGANTGSITLRFTDGVSPWDVWLNGNLILDNYPLTVYRLSPLFADTFRIRVSDNGGSGRIFNDTIILTQPDSIVIHKTLVMPTCQEYELDGTRSKNGSIDLTCSGGVGNYTYSWKDIPTNDSIRIGLYTGIYIDTVKDGNLCTVIDSSILTPQVVIDAKLGIRPESTPITDAQYLPNLAACYLSKWILSADPGSGGYTYKWTPDSLLDNLSDAIKSEASITIRHSSVFDLKVSTNQCYDTSHINILMNDTLGIHITTNVYHRGDSIYAPLNASIGLAVADSFESYEWIPDTIALIDNNTNPNIQLTPYGNLTLGVIGTTSAGCEEFDTVYIIIQKPTETYSVFTPNGDGVNDYWKILNSDEYSDIEVYIYNRWGQLVFHSKHYGIDEDNRWYGKSMKNGKDLQIGTYYFIMKPNNTFQEPTKGTVTIVR